MVVTSVEFRGHPCFKNHWSGFTDVKPINVIIGRNNTGKSRLLDLVEVMAHGSMNSLVLPGYEIRCAAVLDEETLRQAFPEGHRDPYLGGDSWAHHGSYLVEQTLAWRMVRPGQVESMALSNEQVFSTKPYGATGAEARKRILTALAVASSTKLAGLTFRRLSSEREIWSEVAASDMQLKPDGSGATNMIRKHITSSDPAISRDLIEKELLADLNEVFGPDGPFNEITVRQHDSNDGGPWEVYLGQENKGLVPLSRSGSGLQTVLLVLLNLVVIPRIERKGKSKYVFAFEELENNLHPALQRRLLRYIEQYVSREKATVFLTTHSSVALDFFGPSPSTQIVHVTHDGSSARASTIKAHFDHVSAISELGAKPSDLLQANGILWVEGPSDRIYLNKWIDLLSGGELREGRHYQCACYAGALLATAQFSSPEEADLEFINLLRVNHNVIVVCDSDRSSPSGRGAGLKDRVIRIKRDLKEVPGALLWVTAAKEIENYLTEEALRKFFQKPSLPAPGQYAHFFPSKRLSGPSYIEEYLGLKSVDKTEMASGISEHLSADHLASRFDLVPAVTKIIERIRAWNE
jgi:hypothetical protein